MMNNKKAATMFQVVLALLAILFLIIMAQIVWDQIKGANESGYDPLLSSAAKSKCLIKGSRFTNTIDDGDGYPDLKKNCDRCVGLDDECYPDLASCNDSPDNDLDGDGVPNGCDLLPAHKLLGVKQVLCSIRDNTNTRKWGYELYFEEEFTQQCCTQKLHDNLQGTADTMDSPLGIGYTCRKITQARKTELLEFIKDDKLKDLATKLEPLS
jgi:hypothetical protein